MIEENVIQEFLNYELEEVVHPVIYTFFTKKEIEQNLRTELLYDIERGLNNDFAEKYQKKCFVENTSPNDYKIRYFEFESGLKLLAGIRFRGLDIEKPYVALLHRNASIRELPFISNFVKDEFRIFRPKALLYHQSSHIVGHSIPIEHKDKQILLGGIAEISNHSVNDFITIERAVDSSFYQQYRDEYALFHKQYPERSDFARAESNEDIESHLKNAQVYLIKIANVFSGVFITMKESVLGAEGYYVIENFLFESSRGKGYAPQIQSLVCKELLLLGGKVLFGSIYPNNLASYTAAIRSGRIDIGGTVMSLI